MPIFTTLHLGPLPAMPTLVALPSQCVMGVNLDSLRPEPAVEGYSTPGGYSYRSVKPIALAKVMSIAKMIESDFPNKGLSLSGIGGVETGADAAEFILLGSDTVQVGGGC